MIRQGWGSDKEAYRQWFTSHLIPEATAEQSRCFNEAEHASATPEMAEKFLDVVADIDVVGLLPNVKMPTLILHCRDDALVPFLLGQELASRIPGAKFVPLEGRNHIILANDPAHRSFLNAVFWFLCSFRVKLIGLPKCSRPGSRAIALRYARSRSKPA